MLWQAALVPEQGRVRPMAEQRLCQVRYRRLIVPFSGSPSPFGAIEPEVDDVVHEVGERAVKPRQELLPQAEKDRLSGPALMHGELSTFHSERAVVVLRCPVGWVRALGKIPKRQRAGRQVISREPLDMQELTVSLGNLLRRVHPWHRPFIRQHKDRFAVSSVPSLPRETRSSPRQDRGHHRFHGQIFRETHRDQMQEATLPGKLARGHDRRS
jgi:hypothetical protein